MSGCPVFQGGGLAGDLLRRLPRPSLRSPTVNEKCNDAIRKALTLADELRLLADVGDEAREDASCGVLFGVIRDCAYKIQELARKEEDRHRSRGTWL